MFRLTVGRRLALVVAVSIFAITIVVLMVLRGISDDAGQRTEDFVDSVALPVTTFVLSLIHI